MGHDLVEAYERAAAALTEEAALIAAARPDDFAGAAQAPACAVRLTLDALWQRPELAVPVAEYYAVLAATRAEP